MPNYEDMLIWIFLVITIIQAFIKTYYDRKYYFLRKKNIYDV